MEKEFDAVKEMRSIREKLQKEYEKNPGLRRKRLEQICKKYRLTIVDPENWTANRPSTRMVRRRIQNGDKEESYERI